LKRRNTLVQKQLSKFHITGRFVSLSLVFILFLSTNAIGQTYAAAPDGAAAGESVIDMEVIDENEDLITEEIVIEDEETEEVFETDEVANSESDIEVMEEMPLARDIFQYAAVIDLSKTTTAGDGFTIGGSPYPYDPNFPPITGPSGSLLFSASADKKAYKLVQTGVNPNPSDPNAPKQNTCIFKNIYIPFGIEITLVISDIDLTGSITLSSDVKTKLYLEGNNYIRKNIQASTGTTIDISSLNNDDSAGRLTITAERSESGLNSYASIGGYGAAQGGKITINSGTINITSRSAGAAIGGGGNLEGTAGSGGIITINGGIINITQYGAGTNDSGAGIGGAGIGGGGHNGVGFSGDAGIVVINNGKITINQYTRGAGIGGGTFGPAGNITINGGTIDIHAIRNSAQPNSGGGSCIGSGAGTTPSDKTNLITIKGGNINVVSDYAGAGIGNSNNNNKCNITIEGGTIYARSEGGTGIGYVNNPNGSTIKITGGTIVAESRYSSGIGGYGSALPDFILGPGADVKAFSYGTDPAINCKDNGGTGYFVNAGFTTALPFPEAPTLKVHEAGSGNFLKALNMPAGYKNFGYSTDQTTYREDNIRVQNGSVVTGIVVRVADDSENIYSINQRAEYNPHNGNKGNGLLPVKFKERPASTDVTVTLKLTGEYADRTRSSMLTIAFKDSNGTALNNTYKFDVVSGVIPGTGAEAPLLTSITPGLGGTTLCTLKHGQKITIKDVPIGTQINIEEFTNDNGYTTYFKDSQDDFITKSNITGFRALGNDERTFDFMIDMMTIVPTDVKDDWDSTIMMFFAILIIPAGWAVVEIIRRKKWKGY